MNEGSHLKKENRIWCDGCYDFVHFGHANSLRQAKAMCKSLVVGIHSDAEVSKNKGIPVFTQDERYKLVKGIKWVDEVVQNAPYVTDLDILEKYNCQCCVHGDDITVTSDGTDTYQLIKKANRYRNVERTAGISTTAIINRILNRFEQNNNLTTKQVHSKWTGSTNPFLMTTKKIFQFMNYTSSEHKLNDKIVYTQGCFDIFHAGHLDFLENCKTEGDFLIVGLYPDEIVTTLKGPQYPIMSLQERVFNVLSYKCVDEVIIGAPFIISQDLVNQLGIDIVCQRKKSIFRYNASTEDPFQICKKSNIFKLIDTKLNITSKDIIARVVYNRDLYEKRNTKKEEREIQLYQL